MLLELERVVLLLLGRTVLLELERVVLLLLGRTVLLLELGLTTTPLPPLLPLPVDTAEGRGVATGRRLFPDETLGAFVLLFIELATEGTRGCSET